jgi:hypothetical protein
MEPEGSLQLSQELSTCAYPEPDQSSPYQTKKTNSVAFSPQANYTE